MRASTVSIVVRPRAVATTLAGLLLAAAVGCWAMTLGDFPLPVPAVLEALAGRGDPGAVVVVRDLRLPRVVTGLLVGAAFGLAGAMTSAVVRNPLATPDVVGVTAGATAAAVAVLLGGW